MLRIVERDGRTYVYDSTKTRLLCVIKEDRRQIRKDLSNSTGSETSVPDARSDPCRSDGDDPRASCFTTDYSSKEGFLRSFNLVPASTLTNTDLNGHNSDFDRSKNALNGYRLTEFYPVMLLYELNMLGRHHVLNRSTVEGAILRYEKCCGLYSKVCPLRSSMVSEYPVVYKPKNPTNNNNHMYLFNKRQKMERLRILKSGLDRRSRRLLRQCKESRVCLKRLSSKEMRRWMPRGAVAANWTGINKRKFVEDSETSSRKAKSSKYKENIGILSFNNTSTFKDVYMNGCNSTSIFSNRPVPQHSLPSKTCPSRKNGHSGLHDGLRATLWTEAAKLLIPEQIHDNLKSLYTVVKAKYFDTKPFQVPWT